MDVPRLHLSDYLSEGEAFHFARLRLAAHARTPLHTHDYFEMFWIDVGRVDHHVNSQTVSMAPGTVCFVRPQDAHALQPSGGDTVITNLAFRPDTIEHLSKRHGAVLDGHTFWSPTILPDQLVLGRSQARTLNAWAHRLDASGRGQLALEAFLLAVLGLLLHDDPLPPGAETGPAWLAESCRALSRPDVLRQGVKGFVAVSGLDPSHVSRVCSRHTGKPPSVLVANARMALAARLLATTSDPIVDVAMHVGLENLSHFYAQFKAHHGMTPRAFRLKNRYDIVGLAGG